MKKLLLILISVVFFKVYSQQTGAAWFKHYLEGTASDIKFLNDQVGFMSSNIYLTNDNKASFLLKTTDGGHTWDAIPGEFNYITSISVINEDIIWVGTTDKGIYKTTNGGLTWHNYNPSLESSFYVGYDFLDASYVYFFDENNGYVTFRDSTRLLKTTDGGNSWNFITRDAHLSESKLSIPSKDLIFDYSYSLINGQSLLKSIDGGVNWEALTIPTEFGSIDDINSIKFLNEQDGFILDNDLSFFYKTIDGGSSWTKVEAYNSGAWEDHLFVSKDIIYTFIDNKLSKSINGGDSWVEITDDIPILVNELFYSNEKIFLSGGDKTNLFLVENDNIEQLVGLQTGIHNIVNYKKPYFDGDNYNSVHIQNFVNDNGILNYVYTSFDKEGRSSKYFKTDITAESYNDYSTFGLSSSPSGNTKLTFPNPFKTDENNLNWEQLFDLTYPETRYNFTDIKFLNDDEAIAIAEGKIYKTNDKGNNWTITSQLDEQYTVTSMELISENEVRILGDTYFHKTVDGGQNWTTTSIPDLVTSSGWLRKIYSYNENLIWAYGDISTVIRSTDGGTTWETIEFDLNGVSNINFISETEGYLSYLDKVYATYDGGNTWSLNTGDNIGLNRIYATLSEEAQGWLWEEDVIFKLLKNPSLPSIISATSEQVSEQEYNISINWSPEENVTHYKVSLFYYDSFGDEEILYEDLTTNLNHTFSTLGLNLTSTNNLKVRVIAANYQNESIRYSDNITDVVLVDNNLSVKDNSIDSFNYIYPNPVDNELHINSDKEIKECDVYSLDGRKIKSIKKSNTVKTSELPIGFYILKVTSTDNSTSNYKFVKN